MAIRPLARAPWIPIDTNQLVEFTAAALSGNDPPDRRIHPGAEAKTAEGAYALGRVNDSLAGRERD